MVGSFALLNLVEINVSASLLGLGLLLTGLVSDRFIPSWDSSPSAGLP